MQLGIVGLGRMGANIARRLLRAGHDCIVYDRASGPAAALAADGATACDGLGEMVQLLDRPRTIWLMLPAGEATQSAIDELVRLLDKGDCIIDGGNTYWKDDISRAATLAGRGIDYLDIGTSGGVWGLERGYCLMIGGQAATVRRLEPLLATLAPGRGGIAATPGRDATAGTADQGWLHCGGPGAGHFVKMIHNGIEYGMMQALAEGFDILAQAGSAELPAAERLDIDVAEVAEVWRRGSVITSWLLDLTAAALAEDPTLATYSGRVGDSGEGRWTVEAAVERAVPAPVLTAALYARFRSRQSATFADKTLSAMRAGFGGHAEPAPHDPTSSGPAPVQRQRRRPDRSETDGG